MAGGEKQQGTCEFTASAPELAAAFVDPEQGCAPARRVLGGALRPARALRAVSVWAGEWTENTTVGVVARP